LICLIWLLLLPACDKAPRTRLEKRLKRVEVVLAQAEDVQVDILLSAVAQAAREYRISTEVSGRLKAQHVDRGDAVRKGALLFEIEPEPFRLRLQEAEALLARASARWRFTQAEIQRKQPLFKAGSLSKSSWERLKLDAGIAQAEHDQALVALAQARRALRLTRLYSPIDGLILERDQTLGDILPAGASLALVADLSNIAFEVGVSDLELRHLHPQDRVSITLDAFPGEGFEGRVRRISGNASPEKGTFPVEVELQNADGKILPGMVGRLTFSGPVSRDQITLPLAALHREGDATVLDLIENALVVKRSIRVGTVFGDRVLVEEGLSGGEQVVLVSQGRLTAGEQVEIVTVP